MKECSKCGTLKPLAEFYKDARYAQGVKGVCKVCSASRQKSYLSSPHGRTTRSNYIDRTSDHRRSVVADYYKRNREKIRSDQKLYRQDHPELKRRADRKRRANKACAVPQRWRKSPETPGCCYWCGTDITAHYEIDHIMPISLGGQAVEENEVKVCRTCNGSSGKWHKHPLVWVAELVS